MNQPIQKAYDLLFKHFGRQYWWPAETRFEMMLGAILTQNTAWTNVEKAISNLRGNGALHFQILERTAVSRIAEWIRPAGYLNQKAARIKYIITMIRGRFDGSLRKLFALPTSALRKELLSWKGIGPETADSILLYAANRPVFVVDAYTRRICYRHDWIDEKADYTSVARLFTNDLPAEVTLFNEYHALIVRTGREYCRSRPKCGGCPLESLLQDSERQTP